MRTRPGVVCDPRNLTNVRYSAASELLNTPLQTRSLECLSALATLSNCRRSGPPPPNHYHHHHHRFRRHPSRLTLPYLLFLLPRQVDLSRGAGWRGGQGRIDPGRGSAAERGAWPRLSRAARKLKPSQVSAGNTDHSHCHVGISPAPLNSCFSH